ncbi:MAG TPA: DoxX family protein [Gemmatimonadaceae bacterium]|nr:DoxX family protein [Gemmatimonadaceae bacterium]
MSAAIDAVPPSKGQLWTGRILSGLGAVFMLFDATIHLLKPAAVVEGFAKLGFPINTAVPIAIVEFVCIILYLIPRTSIFGAILLTGYLGGAIATQLRVGAPLFSTLLFPIYVALFLWGGLYLRDPLVRTIIPTRR